MSPNMAKSDRRRSSTAADPASRRSHAASMRNLHLKHDQLYLIYILIYLLPLIFCRANRQIEKLKKKI